MSSSRPAALLALVLVALLASLVACTGAHPRPDDALASPVDIIDTLDHRMQGLDDVRIVTRADYYDEREGRRVAGRDVSIAARAPASLRVDLSSSGKSLAGMASDGELFTMLDLINEVYYYGPATPRNISRLLPLYLPGEDFVRVLLGGFPTSELVADWQSKAELGWNSDTGRYQLELPRQDGNFQLVELSHPRLDVELIRIVDAKNREQYNYEAKDFKLVEGVPVPQKSRFTVPAQEVEVTLFVERYEFNVGLNPRIFTIHDPGSVDVVNLADH